MQSNIGWTIPCTYNRVQMEVIMYIQSYTTIWMEFITSIYNHTQIHPIQSYTNTSNTIIHKYIQYNHTQIHSIQSYTYTSNIIIHKYIQYNHTQIHSIQSYTNTSNTIIHKYIQYNHTCTIKCIQCNHTQLD